MLCPGGSGAPSYSSRGRCGATANEQTDRQISYMVFVWMAINAMQISALLTRKI